MLFTPTEATVAGVNVKSVVSFVFPDLCFCVTRISSLFILEPTVRLSPVYVADIDPTASSMAVSVSVYVAPVAVYVMTNVLTPLAVNVVGSTVYSLESSTFVLPASSNCTVTSR